MGVFENVKATIDVNINANGEQRITGKVLNGVLQEIVSASESSSSDLQESLSSLSEKVDNIGSKDFNPSGIYPDLTAGDLAGRGESVPASFGFRASGGKSIKDGRAYIKRIKGNSVVWNQKVEKTYIDRDKVLENIDVIPQNHKFALIRSKAFGGCYYMPSIDVYDYVLTDGEYAKIFVQSHVVDAEYSRIYSTGESGYIQLIDLTQMFGAGNEPSTIEDFNARVATLGIEDMYAYNEGQVIHCNTESIKSIGDNAWDEQWESGVISLNGEELDSTTRIRSKNFNRLISDQSYNILCPDNAGQIILYDEDKNFVDYFTLTNRILEIPANVRFFKLTFASAYGTTYKNDVMISLMHSGWKQDTDAGYQPYWQDILPLPIIRKYFPDGMKKAGSAHDEIRYNKASGKWEYSNGKIKSVDLGTFDYTIGSTNLADSKRMRALTKISDAIIPSSDAQVANILCGSYIAVSSNNNWQNSEGVCISADGYLYVYDKEKQDTASFKADMVGVILYYESNNWEWEELDAEDQNFRDYYQVADFGTEEAIPATDAEGNIIPSAAFSADIIYQFNAVDMIREHEMEINELQKVIATMQAQLTSLTSPTNL